MGGRARRMVPMPSETSRVTNSAMVERLLCRLDRPRMRPGDVVTVLVRELDAQRFLVGDQRRQDDGNLRLGCEYLRHRTELGQFGQRTPRRRQQDAAPLPPVRQRVLWALPTNLGGLGGDAVRDLSGR